MKTTTKHHCLEGLADRRCSYSASFVATQVEAGESAIHLNAMSDCQLATAPVYLERRADCCCTFNANIVGGKAENGERIVDLIRHSKDKYGFATFNASQIAFAPRAPILF